MVYQIAVESIFISKVVRLTLLNPDPEQLNYLMRCHRKVGCDELIVRIKRSIFPVKVLVHKREMYALESFSELELLSQVEPDCQCEVAILGKAKTLDEIQTRIVDHLYFKASSSYGSKALYGLEKYWQEAFNYHPLMSQSDYAKVLGCNRSTLSRESREIESFVSSLQNNEKLDEDLALNSYLDTDFSWDSLTSHIPDLFVQSVENSGGENE